MNKFVLVPGSSALNNEFLIFKANYINSSPCRLIHSLEIQIEKNRHFKIILQTHSCHQADELKKHLEDHVIELNQKYKVIECDADYHQASAIFQILNHFDGLDDSLLCEFQEQFQISFDWSDSLLARKIDTLGVEETLEQLEVTEPDQLFKFAQVVEQRMQDLCELNMENLLVAIDCYSRIEANSPNFEQANLRICTLIQEILQTQLSQESLRKVLAELVSAHYKLKQYQHAAPFLLQLHSISEGEPSETKHASP